MILSQCVNPNSDDRHIRPYGDDWHVGLYDDRHVGPYGDDD